MVFVQHTLTRLYLRSFAEWTAELNDAWVFASTSEAISFCEMCSLTDVQIIVPSESDVQRFPLPERSTAFMLSRGKEVPVILPRTDSRPN
jgi:hypothetical protein